MKLFKYIILLLIVGCQKTLPPQPYPFEDGPKYEIFLDYPQNSEGYYLVDLDTTRNSNRYNIYVGANEVIPYYQYNENSVIEVRFDCDSYYLLGSLQDTLTITLPIYKPFSSVYLNQQFSKPHPVGDTTIILEQFRNSIVPLIQTSYLYLKQYSPGGTYSVQDEFKPTVGNYWTKRIIGPIPKQFYKDTIEVFYEIFWDASNYSYIHPQETTRNGSIKIIFN